MLVKTMLGRKIDMARLMAQHAEKVALGNASMNARGDLVDSQGGVTKPREELARDYHRANPKAVRPASRDITQEVTLTPDEAFQQVVHHRKASRRKIVDGE